LTNDIVLPQKANICAGFVFGKEKEAAKSSLFFMELN
jgi:hypothetical protein